MPTSNNNIEFPVKIPTFENLTTFSDQMKAKYAKIVDLNAVTGQVKALEDVGAEANVLEGVKVNGTALASLRVPLRLRPAPPTATSR